MKASSLFQAFLCTTALLITPAFSQEAKRAEVLHWMTSESEVLAVKVLADAFNAAGGEWVDAAVAGYDAAKAAAATRIQAGDAPAAVFYTSVNDVSDLVENGLMIDLNSVATAGNWQQTMPEAVLNAISRNGNIYAAPLNVGVDNYLWTSPIALAKIGATEPPKTWDELFAMGDKLKEAGVVPFAQSGMWYWYLMTLGSVLATQGADTYNAFHALDPAVLDTPEFKNAIEIFVRLREYSDDGVPGREWNLSNGMVMRGEAAFQIMGDWAKGEIAAGGMEPGKDVLCTIGVSNSPVTMGSTVVTFPETNNEATLAAQQLLAEVVTTPAVQLAFSQAKGSLPVRTDTEGGTFDTCAQVAIDAQRANSSVAAYPNLISADAAGSIGDLLGNFWVDKDATADDLISQLRDAFATFE